MMKKGYFDKDVRVAGSKGTAKTSNKGLCDVLLCNMALQQQLFQQDMVARAAGTCSSPAPCSKWVDQDVAPANAILPDMVPGGPRRQLGLAHDALSERVAMAATGGRCVFGTIWDSVIKAHVTTGVLPADALNQGIFL